MANNSFKILFLVGLTLFAGFTKSLNAQFFETGDPPANVRWRTFYSEHFQFIFPEDFELLTREYAVSFDQAWEKVTQQLRHSPDAVPVIIHPHVSQSNGLVAWAPRRMEIYPVTPQTIDGQSWIRLLAIHEIRHVAQISKLNQGFTSFLTLMAGEAGTGLTAGLIPSWFYEGDAVYAETAFSLAGRGRDPSFEMKIKAQVTDDKRIFSYDKSLFRSYRDFVPNHYEYGYQLVSFASEKYGHDIWVNTLNFTARNPFIPFSFRAGLKNQIGITPSELYRKTIDYRKNHWKNELQSNKTTDHLTFSPEKSDFINYYSPQFITDTSLVVLKDGPGYLRQIVTLNKKGEERTLHIPGFVSVNRISANGGKITWSETIPHKRWGNKSYSVIKLFDLNTNTENQLTRKSRFYAPALSPSGNYIATIENDLMNNCFLVILNSSDGTIISREKTPGGTFLQFPAWTSENEIVMTLLDDNGKHLMVFSTDTKVWEKILSGGNYDISRLAGNKEIILFHATWNGTDNIYALNRSSGNIYFITQSRHGAFEPAINSSGTIIAFSDYTNRGFEIKLSFPNFSPETSFTPPIEKSQPFYSAAIQNPVVFNIDKEKASGFISKPYRKTGSLFHFHSWAPFYYDFKNLDPVGNTEIYPGITLLSQNLLNTAVTQISYAYKNGNHFTSNSFTYSGFLPIMEFAMDYGDEPQVFSGRDTLGPGEIKNDLLNFRSRFYIPLNLTRNRFVTGLTPLLQISYNNSYYHYTLENEYRRGRITLDWRLNFFSYLRLSLRDISPLLGYQIRLRYLSSPFEDENFGSIFTATAIGFLPGFFDHHSIRLRANYQKQNPQKYIYRSILDFPRGFTSSRTERLHVLNADYIFPIIYPDLSIPGILFLKRIRGLVFIDYAINQNRVFNTSLNRLEWRRDDLYSTGAEIMADYHIFRLLMPFSTGIRINFMPEQKKTTTEFLFSINLNVF